MTRNDVSVVTLDGADVMIFLFRSPLGTSPKEMIDVMLGGTLVPGSRQLRS